MKLQKFSVLVFIFLIILFLVIVNIFISLIILSNYGDLERQYVTDDLKNVVHKINDELNRLSRTASDWGPWNETAEFASGYRVNYVSDNLQPDSYDNLFINDFVIASNSGDIFYSGSYDFEKKRMVMPLPFFTRFLNLSNPLMNTSDSKKIVNGILLLPESPLLVVSQPIVRSDYSGPIVGVLIMGKRLDRSEILRLQSLTQTNISLININDPSLPPALLSKIRNNTKYGFNSIQNSFSSVLPGTPVWAPSEFYIEALDNEQVAGYTILKDIYGKEALILQIFKPRDIFKQGINTALFFISIILVGGLVLGFVFIILLNQLILKRINSLALQVHMIGQSGTAGQRVEVQRDDELSSLAYEINWMLETIEQTRKNLQESEEQIREVVENIPDYVIIYSLNREILYINPAVEQVIGNTADSVIGKPVLTIVSEDFRNQMEQRMNERQNGESVPPYEIEISIQDNTKKTILVKGRNIRYKGYPATLLLLIDITERKEYEREREIHAQELERISLSLKQANRQVNLLSSITRHDILNQVNIGLLCLDILERRYKDPEFKINFHGTLLGEIDEKKYFLEKMDNIITVIETIQHQIEFTRVYEGLGMQEPQWRNLESILSQLHLPSEISFSANVTGILIYADKMLEKVFFNLVDNSFRHGQGVTEIQLYFRQCSENMTIFYEDNGTGIPIIEKEHIFERGYGKNTGFGLFLVREILSLTEISICESGIEGKGVRFEISVPNKMVRINN